MCFEEVYESWTKKCLTREEAAELLGVCARTFRRHIDRYEDNGLNGEGDARNASIEWRYYLIEVESTELPLTCIDYMHEIVFGALKIIQVSEHQNEESEYQDNVRQFLYSQRQVDLPPKFWTPS